jgi:Ni,Fe-hydrogenase maturation factor
VLGVGSSLRRDDGAGRAVAETVGAWHREGVEARPVHQLTPELAVEVADRDLVVFVDAAVGIEHVVVEEVVVETVTVDLTAAGGVVGWPAPGGTGVVSHHVDLAAVLSLATLVGQAPARVVTVAVPVHDLGLGAELSPATAAAVEEALARIWDLLDG